MQMTLPSNITSMVTLTIRPLDLSCLTHHPREMPAALGNDQNKGQAVTSLPYWNNACYATIPSSLSLLNSDRIMSTPALVSGLSGA